MKKAGEDFHEIARGVIFDEDRVLVARTVGKDYYHLPGGHVEAGEEAVETLRREIFEELGVGVRVGEYLGAIENSWEEEGMRNFEVNQVFLVRDGERLRGKKSLEKHLSFKWVKVMDLAEVDLRPRGIGALIRKYFEGEREIWRESVGD